ncbi:MAG: hypothetical protein BroJett021_36060 [Chloroflexota bacterium]|nr:hypothetical protein [Caldilinea sp.]GIK74618.1 MAG: hypothetical protein BroJett021_36060 [Chloroflexota bacterium]
MQNRRLALLLSMLLILSTVLAGCMPRPGQGNLAASSAADSVVVDIPAIALVYDEQGQASLKGLDLSALGVELDALARTPEQIAAVRAAGIESAYVDISPSGVGLYANGRPMLTMDWDASTIQSLGAVIGIAGVDNADTLAKVLPLVSNMSLGVAMLFPDAGSNPTLVGPAPDKAAALAAAQAGAAAVLGELGIPPFATGLLGALGPLTIRYNATGTATLEGLGMIANFLPPDALAGLNLDAEQMEQVAELGIQTINVQTKPEGLAITLNGNALPLIRWDSGQMSNLVTLGLDGGALTAMTGADAESLDALRQLGKFAPLLQTTPLNISVVFPE